MNQSFININQRREKKVLEVADSINYLPSSRLSRRLIKKAQKDKDFLKSASPRDRYIHEMMLRISIDSHEAICKMRIHKILQFSGVIGATLVTIFVGLPNDLNIPKVIIFILSGIVTMATVLINLLRYGEQSYDLYLIAVATQKELDTFKNEEGDYAELDDYRALKLFKKRTSALNYDRIQKMISVVDVTEKN